MTKNSTKKNKVRRWRKDKKERLIRDDDIRAQKIMSYLWGTWHVDSLEKRIARYFQCKGHPALTEVAQRIADIHCGEGYVPEDITNELEKVLPDLSILD